MSFWVTMNYSIALPLGRLKTTRNQDTFRMGVHWSIRPTTPTFVWDVGYVKYET